MRTAIHFPFTPLRSVASLAAWRPRTSFSSLASGCAFCFFLLTLPGRFRPQYLLTRTGVT
eukprot:COSAG01_NODE_7970_length_2970_cov_1.643330_5_plen_60_part_00